VAPPSDAVPLAPLTRAPADAAPMTRPDPAALQPNIGATLHDVARMFRRRFERRARQTGLPVTRQQARALLYIARNEGLSQAAVATMLDIEPIALVRMLDRLHEEGLVERRPHPTDRRVRTLWLTLYTTPVIYLYLDRLSRWVGGSSRRPSRLAEALSDTPRPRLAEDPRGAAE